MVQKHRHFKGSMLEAEGTGGAQARCSWLLWLGWAEALWVGDSRAVAGDGLGLLAGAPWSGVGEPSGQV